MTPDRPKAARDLLEFYIEAGADALLGEAPVDRFADQEPARSPAPPASGASGRRPPLSYTSPQTRGSGERAAPPATRAPPPPKNRGGAASARRRRPRPPRGHRPSPPPTRASRRDKPRASTSCAG